MISFTYLSLFVFGVACTGANQEVQETSQAPSLPQEVGQRVLTKDGYMIRYGDAFYRYPYPVEDRVQQVRVKPVETNEVESDTEVREEKGRPLFFFTYEVPVNNPAERPLSTQPYIEIRKKRDVDAADVPESSKVGKLRRKRTYCRKCGGGRGGYGGYGGYYIPVTYAVYPVYGGGGVGQGCKTCGGGYPSHGGGGGSFSYSSSSAHSSSGSFGWGKK